MCDENKINERMDPAYIDEIGHTPYMKGKSGRYYVQIPGTTIWFWLDLTNGVGNQVYVAEEAILDVYEAKLREEVAYG
jgi:hypothetical protein